MAEPRTLTVGNAAKFGGRTPWVVDGYWADVVGGEVIKALPSSGYLYLRSISIQCPDIVAGPASAICSGTDTVIGLLGESGNGLYYSKTFIRPIRFVLALTVNAQDYNPTHVLAKGFIT